MTSQAPNASTRWFVLILATLTAAIMFAISYSGIVVLFPQISKDLHLSIEEIGSIWGIGSLGGLFMSIPGGIIVDRIGTRKMLTGLCVLGGLASASRGLSSNYLLLLLTTVLFGFFAALTPMNAMRIAGIWFPDKRGIAAGIISTGMGLGYAMGSAFNGTWLAPALGDWRAVLFLFGGICIALGMIWFLLYPQEPLAQQVKTTPNIREGLA